MFVGTYTRKLQRGGWVRFPKDWLPFIGDHRTVFIMPDPDKNKSLLLVMSDDFNRELERMKDKNVPSESLETLAKIVVQVKVTADGRMQIPARLLAHAGIQDGVCFAGHIRTIAVTPIHCA